MTPDAPDCLEEFDSDKVYIIGLIPDHDPEDATLIKAIDEGLEIACLPLAKYLTGENYTKALTVIDCFRILSDASERNNLHEAISAFFNSGQIQISQKQGTLRRTSVRQFKKLLDAF